MSKSYNRWLTRVKDFQTPWTEKEIIYFRKAVGQAGIKNSTERMDLLMRVSGRKYRITTDHSEKGRNYLLNKTLKRNGGLRKGAKLGRRELQILRNLSHHNFVGLYEYCPGYYFPIYEAVSLNGKTFSYIGCTYSQLEVLS